ncbi:MAG: hypothetical protein J4469_03200 [Candidatus Aenigmarchaeota archaeon]|nr:hypothetical protein [Candidatus Aenigmarchaeota archaeon]
MLKQKRALKTGELAGFGPCRFKANPFFVKKVFACPKKQRASQILGVWGNPAAGVIVDDYDKQKRFAGSHSNFVYNCRSAYV